MLQQSLKLLKLKPQEKGYVGPTITKTKESINREDQNLVKKYKKTMTGADATRKKLDKDIRGYDHIVQYKDDHTAYLRSDWVDENIVETFRTGKDPAERWVEQQQYNRLLDPRNKSEAAIKARKEYQARLKKNKNKKLTKK